MNGLGGLMRSLLASIGIVSREQVDELLTSKGHGAPFSQHRAGVVLSRVYFFSTVFAMLVPAWMVIDFIFLPLQLWWHLTFLRFISGVVFSAIAWQSRLPVTLLRARVLLGSMLVVTPVFYIVSEYWIAGYGLEGAQSAIAGLYALLPFVMVAGLAVFPLTLREFLICALPMLAIIVAVIYPETEAEIPQMVDTLWLFVLIMGVALFSSLGQLRYMLSQVTRASFDELTGALTRRAGVESIELQYRVGQLRGDGLAILYFDLDNFKAVNDTFGHKAGDEVLRQATRQLQANVRKGDSVVRWGGEEFVVILPGADCEAAAMVNARIMEAGLGERPDGAPTTASVGVAETRFDEVEGWKELVEVADQRMYRAKSAGRARSICCDGREILWPSAQHS